MKKVNTLIIGSGISGLAYAANTDDDYLILEKDSSPGGLCRTFYVDGFVWDYAGHFFHFVNPHLKKKFELEINDNNMVKCIKSTNVNYNGINVEYPFQMNIHQLPKDEFIDCLYDLFHRIEKEKYTNFEDMLYGKFGKSITEKFLKPYNEKLYACSLDKLDPDAMGRFFPYADPAQIIYNMKKNNVQTYNSTFDYPVQGAQFFVERLLGKINLDKLLLNSCVEAIDINAKTVIVDGMSYQYNKLINTMPLNQFVKILSGVDAAYDGIFNCNKVLVFNLGFDKQAMDIKTHWTYVPMRNINFYRMGFYSNILGSDRLSMYIEIGYKEDEKIDVENQLKATLENLRKLGIITDHKLIAYNALVINPAYVHIAAESAKQVIKLQDLLKEKSVYTIGRYGKWTYCSIEDYMLDAINLAREISTRVV